MAYYNSPNGSNPGPLQHGRMLGHSGGGSGGSSNNNNNNSSNNTSSNNNSSNGSSNRSSSTGNNSASSSSSFHHNPLHPRQNLHLSNSSPCGPLSLAYPRSNQPGGSSSFHHHGAADFRDQFVENGLEAAVSHHHHHHNNPDLYLPLHQAFSHLQGCRGLPDLGAPPSASCLSNQEAAVLSVANFRDYISGGAGVGGSSLNPHDVYGHHNPSAMDYCNGLGAPVHCNTTPVYPWMTVVGEFVHGTLLWPVCGPLFVCVCVRVIIRGYFQYWMINEHHATTTHTQGVTCFVSFHGLSRKSSYKKD